MIETKEITVEVKLSFDCSFAAHEMDAFLERFKRTIVYSLYDNADIIVKESEIKLIKNGN